MSSINNHHHDDGLGSSPACELDQTLFVRGAYTASDDTPAQEEGLATWEINVVQAKGSTTK